MPSSSYFWSIIFLARRAVPDNQKNEDYFVHRAKQCAHIASRTPDWETKIIWLELQTDFIACARRVSLSRYHQHNLPEIGSERFVREPTQ
jgi:hypothetical protein